MIDLLSKGKIEVNDSIYLKDPMSSKLGMKILAGGVDMLSEIGFDELTFRKLAFDIDTTEASIYRYFENKHKLLLYLTCWYWGWMEYRLVFTLANIQCPKERLARAIKLLTQEIDQNDNHDHIDTMKLYDILVTESSKSYLIKSVDKVNQDGAYLGYKKCVGRVSDIVLEINPEFQYPHMLISTAIEGAHHQRFFSAHLPRLTDQLSGEDSVVTFYLMMVFNTIGATYQEQTF